jgi:hypothetical protein
MNPVLTDDERELIQDLGRIYRRIAGITGGEPTREDDLREIRFHIHGLQRAIMAQAAARAYPGDVRGLGGAVVVPPARQQ